jgi:hypothetical protein
MRKNYMGEVDQMHKDENKEKREEHNEPTKHTFFSWFKNPLNLTDDQKAKLSDRENLNLEIFRAYLHKNRFLNL